MHPLGWLCAQSLDVLQVNYWDQALSTEQRCFHRVAVTEPELPGDPAGKRVRLEFGAGDCTVVRPAQEPHREVCPGPIMMATTPRSPLEPSEATGPGRISLPILESPV